MRILGYKYSNIGICISAKSRKFALFIDSVCLTEMDIGRENPTIAT